MSMSQTSTASALWDQYRDTMAIRKAEDFAKFTIASLMVDPLRYTEQAQTVEYDFQSSGSLLVNNLTSKLAMALFPPGRPSFQIELEERIKQLAKAQGISESTILSSTAELERQATKRLFLNASLAKLHRVIKLLLVTGNSLLYRDSARAKFLVWCIQSYVVRRNSNGDLYKVILKQQMPFNTLPAAIQNDAVAKRLRQATDTSRCDLYTTIDYKDTPTGSRRAEIWHELDGKRVGPMSSYPEHLCPYVVSAWNVPDGEHYGRGYVEEYSGAFAKLSLLSEQLGLYELESLNVLNLVDESAGAVVDDYKEADTGDYVPGKANAITAYERGDYNKIVATNNSLQSIVMLLNRAFMFTGQMRDAERVTVEEVRTIAQEAENLMGGAYSLLAENLQAPLAYLTMAEVANENPNFMLGLVDRLYRPSIITGIPALTRNAETQNLMRATQEAAAVVPALAQLSKRFDTERVIELIFNNNSVDLEAVSKDADQIAAEAQQEAAVAQSQLDVASGALAATEGIPGVLTQ